MSSDEITSLVLDCGSYLTKAGFAGNYAPDSINRAVIGDAPPYLRNKTQFYFGYETYNHANDIRSPFDKHSYVTNWEDMARIWRYTMEKELRVRDIKEHPVLLSEPPLNPKANREKMTTIVFEGLHMPAFYAQTDVVLSLYAAGRTTGVVVDSGYQDTCVAAIYEGFLIENNVTFLDVAGKAVTDYFKTFVRDPGPPDQRPPFETSTEIYRFPISDIKEKMCHVALSFEEEMKKDPPVIETYMLPDGYNVPIGRESFQAPEILFQPKIVGIDQAPLHQMVVESIMKSDPDIHRDLSLNIVLSGGTTMFKGFPERLQKELENPEFHLPRIKISVPEDTKWSAWIGGSILASLNTFQQLRISKQEYEENGASIIHRKCL